jgi:hypothetical protein
MPIVACLRIAVWRCLASYMVMSALAGCGGGGDSGPWPSCGQFGGTWNVALDYGNGLVAHQQWTIAQSRCELTLTGTPSDDYGPSLGAAVGSAGDTGIWATWTKTVDSCRYYSNLETTVSGNSLSGSLYWSRSAYGQGYCSPGSGNIAVSGNR